MGTTGTDGNTVNPPARIVAACVRVLKWVEDPKTRTKIEEHIERQGGKVVKNHS
jgi:hypothetical protein